MNDFGSTRVLPPKKEPKKKRKVSEIRQARARILGQIHRHTKALEFLRQEFDTATTQVEREVISDFLKDSVVALRAAHKDLEQLESRKAKPT